MYIFLPQEMNLKQLYKNKKLQAWFQNFFENLREIGFKIATVSTQCFWQEILIMSLSGVHFSSSGHLSEQQMNAAHISLLFCKMLCLTFMFSG